MKNLLILLLLLIACGDPELDLDEIIYQPKIVVDAYLIVGQSVENIFIKRNYPVTGPESTNQFYITNATVRITDVALSVTSTLTYTGNPIFSYSDDGTLGQVKANTLYRIDVEAVIDGKQLITSSETLTPANGFTILDKTEITKKYPVNTNERNNNRFEINFNLINGATTYIAVIKPLTANKETFINYPRNVYLESEIDKNDYLDEVGDIESVAVLDIKNDLSDYSKDVEWDRFNFVSRYRIILYAADQNYKDYFFTADENKSDDGDYSQPIFHFTGDGIGVFGSASADTVYFNVNL